MRKFFRILTAPLRWLIAPFGWIRDGMGTVSDFFTEVPEDVSLTETIGGAFEGGDAFKETLRGVGEHLMALRTHIFRSVVALALTTTFSFLFAQNLMEALAQPLPHGLQDLQVTIEVRFITLNDNFFERIGIDFDFQVDDNTGLTQNSQLNDDAGRSIAFGVGD